jgi:hypothetical protein
MTHEDLAAILVQHQLMTPERRDQLLAESPSHPDKLWLIDKVCAAGDTNEQEVLDVLARHVRAGAMRVRLSQVPHDPAVLPYLSAREAWDHLVLPLAFGPGGELICCTTEQSISSALACLLSHVQLPFTLVLADVAPLEMYIAEQYHYEGVEIDAA